MKCPYCGKSMKELARDKSATIAAFCEGGFLSHHARIGLNRLDGKLVTSDESTAKKLERRGFLIQLNSEGKYYEIDLGLEIAHKKTTHTETNEAVHALQLRVNDFDPTTRNKAMGSLLSLGQAGWDVAFRQFEGSMRMDRATLQSLAQYAGQEQAKKFLIQLMASSRSMARRLDAAITLDEMGWCPESRDQELQCMLANQQYSQLLSEGASGKQLLLFAVKDETTRYTCLRFLSDVGALEWAVRAICDQLLSCPAGVFDRDLFDMLVEVGMDLAIPALISVQECCGDKDSATVLLNCDCPQLEEAAESWAYKHGYRITRSATGRTKRWGSLDLKRQS